MSSLARPALAAVAALASFGAGGALLLGSAQADEPRGASRGGSDACVGSVRLDLTFGGPGGPTRPFVGTFSSDRTAIFSAAGATATFVPGGAAVEYSSPGHGTWRPAGRQGCRVTVVQLDADSEGKASGSARATLDVRFDRDRLTAAGTTTTFDPAGNVVGDGIPTSGSGSRIEVER